MGTRVIGNFNVRAAINGSALFDRDMMLFEGKPTRAFRITCGTCGVLHRVKMNPMRGKASSLEVQQEDIRAARKFREAGWEVGSTRNKHRCPAHTTLAPLKKEDPMPPVVKKLTPPPEPQLIPPPREMSRTDRRIIFDKLSDVYLDEAHGYSGDLTDKRVAEDLGVPMAWVATIRDENFGPVSTNPTIDSTLDEARKLVEDMRKMADGLTEKAGVLVSKAGEIEVRLVDIQNRVRP